MHFYTNPSNKKWAVLYATWCGSTRDAFAWISEGMNRIADVFDIREKPDLMNYDYIIIGSAIRSWQSHPDLQVYIKENKDWLKNKIRGFFAVCGNYGRAVEQQQTTMFIDNHLAKLCEVTGVPSRVFNGRITKSLWEPELVAELKKQAQPLPDDPEKKPRPTLLDMPDYDKLSRWYCMDFGKLVFEKTK